jgi:uncharacterized membrane protein HdeD (DUF308 family)
MLNKTGIEQYFMAQKQAGLVFIVIGVLAAIAAIAGWLLYKTPFWKGAALPFIVVGLMQLVAGYRVYTESDELRISNIYALDMNPQLLKTKELPRMQAIHKRFALYSTVQWALLGTGMLLLLLYRNKPEYAFWYGFGVALAIQAVVLIVVYYFAAQRANVYTTQIDQFVQQL